MEGKNELQRNAIAEARRKELETFQQALDIQWMNSRMEDGRMGRLLALIQREGQMEKDFQERTDHAALVNAKADAETSLGIEVAQVRREEVCELLRRHYLRERDPSLRELARKLQAGYVCRDLRQQILHNEYRRLQEKAEDMQANTVLRNALYNEQEEAERLDQEKIEQNTKYRQELQQQLVNRQKQKQCQYEDSLIEKRMTDDILRMLADEDKKELEQKRYLTQKMRAEMKTFKSAQDAWKEKQKQMVLKEEKELEEQRKAASDRSTAIIEERNRRVQAREDLNAKIAAKILADEEQRQKRSDLINLLQEQEYLEKNAQDDIAGKEKAERVKRETKEALTAQMEVKKKLEQEQKAFDHQYRLETEARVRADDQKERDKELKLKEKKKQYAKELTQQVKQQQELSRQNRREEELRAQYVWDSYNAWESEVKEERRKIMREHTPHLLGYLQAGVLKKEDLPAVREGANLHKELAGLDIEAMAVSNRPKRFAKCNEQCRAIRKY